MPTDTFQSTPATNLLYGLREAISTLLEEGLEQVFQRHLRLGEATGRAVRGWGLELLCLNPAEYSASCTAILMPDGFDEARFRALVLEYYNLSLGAGLGRVAGRVFRIGHLGDLNDLMLCGTLCGVEMGLAPFRGSSPSLWSFCGDGVPGGVDGEAVSASVAQSTRFDPVPLPPIVLVLVVVLDL